jgi:hypothetical protein
MDTVVTVSDAIKCNETDQFAESVGKLMRFAKQLVKLKTTQKICCVDEVLIRKRSMRLEAVFGDFLGKI